MELGSCATLPLRPRAEASLRVRKPAGAAWARGSGVVPQRRLRTEAAVRMHEIAGGAGAS